MSRSVPTIAALLLALGFTSGARAASYQLLNGSVLGPIEVRFSDTPHAYSGPDLQPSAWLVGASLANADLRDADLRFAIVSSADLSGALLTGVVLSSGELSGTDLSNAMLSGGDISGTNLTVANLDGADLSGTNLAAVIGLGTTTGSPFYDDTTNFAGTGFDPVASGWRRVHRLYDPLLPNATWSVNLLHGGPYVECTGMFTVPGNLVSAVTWLTGNPGSHRALYHAGFAGCGPTEFSSSHVHNGYSWDPAVDGPLESVTVRFDAAVTDCCENAGHIGDETAFGVVVRQGGVDYVSINWIVSLGAGWSSLHFKNLQPQALSAVNGPPGQIPDFSATGQEIRFGFYAYHAKEGQTVTSDNSVDNFEVIPHRPACANELDDDGDGKVDFAGGDPGCASPEDPTEKDETGTWECDDGVDNDLDGYTDYVFDADGDGIADAPGDPACADSYSRENAFCQDGIDNDGDLLIDFDGGASLNFGIPLSEPDPQCVSKPWSNAEGASRCGLGLEVTFVLPLLAWVRRRRGQTHG